MPNAIEMPKTHIIQIQSAAHPSFPQSLFHPPSRIFIVFFPKIVPSRLQSPLSNLHVASCNAALGLTLIWSKVLLWQDAHHGE